MSDDDKMGFKEVIGGAIIGTGAGYGAAAISGRKLKNVKFTDLVHEGKETFKKSSSDIVSDIKKFAADYKLEERGISPEKYQAAANRTQLKIAEKIGYDTTEIAKQIKILSGLQKGKIEDQEQLGKVLQELMEGSLKQTKAIFEKFPTVGSYTKLTRESQHMLADTLAETLGITGAERTKFAEDYVKLASKHFKSAFSSIENAGRKVIGAVKYENASMWKKPLVAFEAMSTKGKIGLGALVMATSLGAAYALNHTGGHKEQDAPSR